MTRLRVGTRGSALARAQTALVADALRKVDPDLAIDVIVIATSGDRLRGPLFLDQTTSAVSVKGLFTKEIEEALLRDEIDAAVHSLKDLPTMETPGLTLAAVPARGDPRDAMATRDGAGLRDLTAGARVGTGSARRDVLVRERRPDLTVGPIRGNVDTRLRKLAAGEVEALVLAAAGLIRLGRRDAISEFLPPEEFVPAPGQGALAVQVRAGDGRVEQIIQELDDAPTRVAVETERAFAERVGGGCRLPVGGYAVVADGRLRLIGMVVLRGRPLRLRVEGDAAEGRRLAVAAAAEALEAIGAGEAGEL